MYYAASLGLHLLPSLHGNRSHQSVQRHCHGPGLPLASLQLCCCCWTSLLPSTVSINPFSSKFSNYNLVSRTAPISFAVALLIPCLKVPHSVVPHLKSVLFCLVSLKVQFLVHSSFSCTPPTLSLLLNMA